MLERCIGSAAGTGPCRGCAGRRPCLLAGGRLRMDVFRRGQEVEDGMNGMGVRCRERLPTGKP